MLQPRIKRNNRFIGYYLYCLGVICNNMRVDILGGY